MNCLMNEHLLDMLHKIYSDREFLFGVIEKFWWWLHNIVNVVNVTEIYG